jgi:hypothetical protein
MDLEAHHRWWKRCGRNHVNRVLHDDWNPIGFQAPDDEYSTYAGTVGRMLHEGSSVPDIADYLGSAREYMGLHRDPDDDLADERVAASLARWYATEHQNS